MRSSRSQSHSFRRILPTFELLEDRNPASLLWVGAAASIIGTPLDSPPMKITRPADTEATGLSSLDAILTPTRSRLGH
jgi:hypothetical protein